MKEGICTLYNSTIKCALVFGTAAFTFVGSVMITYPEEVKNYLVAQSKIKEKIVYKDMSSKQKWDSLSLDDKVYFIKTGYDHLSNLEKEKVQKDFKNEFGYNSETIDSKIESCKKYIDRKFSREEKSISTKEELRNIRNLKKYLGGY